MIYKDYSSKIEDLDEKGRVLVAANGIGNQDADGDISAKGSFDLTLKKDFPRLRWFLNHDKNILLGVPIEGKEDGEHLKMLGQLNMKKQVSRDIYEDYKLWAEHGRTLEHSIGVKDIKRNDKNKNIVEQWELREYSTLTSWGANSNTPMLGIKAEKLFTQNEHGDFVLVTPTPEEIQTLSIGVKDIKRNDKNKNIVEQWELREYSTLTSWGANSNTPMLGIKAEKLFTQNEHGDFVLVTPTPEEIQTLTEEKEFAEFQMKKGNYSDERFRKIEQKLKDILKILGSVQTGEDAVSEPTTQEVHQVEPVAFDPAKLKAAADALALRTFINKLNSKENG
jgi:HK97 family phage prohead protease